MTGDWQTWAALAVVALTAAIMMYRVFLRKKAGCGAGCGCDALKPKARFSWKRDARIPPPGTKGWKGSSGRP